MLLKQIILNNFRNFAEKKFEFSPFLTIIIGENARGKTNLLESVYLITQSEGFRESKEDELIMFEQNQSFVQGIFGEEGESFLYQIIIKKIATGVDKNFAINKSKKKNLQYRKETVKTVLFSPEQIDIMTGPPDKRRRYFDSILSNNDLFYKKSLSNYENALKRRNKILETYRDERDLNDELAYWDNYLEQQADYLSKKRQFYIDFLNSNNRIEKKEFVIKYLKNEFNKQRLEENLDLERRYRKTVIGPQKDDFEISQNGSTHKNLHHFGSRSEQRLAIFWLKFNEIKYIEEKLKVRPILLLDDIFSELDSKNKKLIIDLVKKYQTIVTTTERELIELSDSAKIVINL